MSRKIAPRCRYCGSDHYTPWAGKVDEGTAKVNCKAIQAREQRKDQRALATRGMKKR
jgi:hypothetical protein